MDRRGIGWLYGELPELIRAGVIDDATAERLRDHYGGVPPRRAGTFALVVFGVLGATLIGTGIMLLIGHNWDNLSRPARTALSFAPLVAGQCLCGWALTRGRSSRAWCEGAGTFLTLAIGSCIALIGQTYHIPGNLADFLFVWALLGLPVAYLLNAALPAALYIAGITAWAGAEQAQSGDSPWFWLLAALVAPYLWHTFRRAPRAGRSVWLSLVLTICATIATALVLTADVQPALGFVAYMALFTVLYLGGGGVGDEEDRAVSWRGPFRLVGAAGIAIVAFIMSYSATWDWLDLHDYGAWKQSGLGDMSDLILSAVLLAAAAGLLVWCIRRGWAGRTWLGVAPAVVIAACLAAGLTGSDLLGMLFCNLYLVLLGIAFTAQGLRRDRLALLNGGLIILAAWITARFFDSDLGFVARGVAFIVMGMGFLITNVILVTRRRRTDP